MTRFAILALLAFPAYAEEYPARIERIGAYGHDSVEIVAHEAPHTATVRYTNSSDNSSSAGTVTIQIGEIIVDVTIEIGGRAEDNREIATVIPRGDYVALPDRVLAYDGETAEVLILLPMF